MAFVKISDLTNTLENARKTLLEAANGDGMVSRADLRNLIKQTEDPLQSRFLEVFYSFLRKLEDRPNMRITRDVIDRGIVFIQEQIIPNFEIQEQFTLGTNQKIAQIHQAAFPMAMELIRATTSTAVLSPRQVSEEIAKFSEVLYFDDYGSEAAIGIDPFFLEHPERTLSPESFTKALGLDPNTPEGKVEYFDPADRAFLTFVEQKITFSHHSSSAQIVVDLIKANLNDHRVIILGEPNVAYESNHPAYVVGIGQNGNIAGFVSAVVWT